MIIKILFNSSDNKNYHIGMLNQINYDNNINKYQKFVNFDIDKNWRKK